MEHIESLISHSPADKVVLQPLIETYRKKLWHQLTEQLELVKRLPMMKKDSNLVKLYTNFVKSIEDKLNPLKLAQLMVSASHQLTDSEATAFLEEGVKAVKSDEGKLVINAQQALNLLRADKWLESKRLLENVKQELDALAMADPTVHSAYYHAALEFFKRQGPASEYYKAGLAYLEYTPIGQITAEEQTKLAFEMALAALLGEDVYNFGEMVQSPVFGALERGGHKWLADVVVAFNRGDIASYRELRRAHDAQFKSISTLNLGDALLNQKLIILSLMDMVFVRPAADRTLTFADISQRTQLPLDQVEFCVMKALALGLIRGSIDEVSQTVTVSWVQPRVLDVTQVAAMRERLVEWLGTVHGMVATLSTETRELSA